MKATKYILLLLLILMLACDGEGILFETDISNREVQLLAPADGSEVASNAVRFDWESVEDATSYEIQIATPNFDQAVQLVLNTTLDSITNYQFELPLNDYAWRIRAKNSGYETAYSTASFSVVPVVNFSDFTVILSTPQNDLITNNPEQTLSWEAIPGAVLYRVQVLQNGLLLEEITNSDNEVPYTFLDGAFTWQVRAENGTENTLYSTRNILVDTTVPNTAVLISPTDGSTLDNSEVDFEWTRQSIPGSQEFDRISIYRDSALTDLVLQEETASPFQTTLENNTYFWLVSSFDAAGNESEDSEVFSFIVDQ